MSLWNRSITLAERPLIALLLLLAPAVVHLATLTISPTVWQDEVQIVDFGRNMRAPDPQASMRLGPTMQPLTPPNYLGPMIQEAAYQTLAPSIAGPRLASLAAAVLAAYGLFMWLRSRQVAAGPALLLAMAFLLDPIFVQGYRGARVDAWAIALVIAACLVIRREAPRLSAEVRFAIASALVVIAMFVWPSAIFMGPLVAVEAVAAIRRSTSMLRTAMRGALAVVAGGATGLVLCVLPIAGRLDAVLADTAVVVGGAAESGGVIEQLPTALLKCLLSFEQSPMVLLLGLVAALLVRNELAVALVAGVLAISQTEVYIHRVVYLLPYLFALMGDAWRELHCGSARVWWTRAIGVALIWASALSLLGRPLLAWSAREARNPQVNADAIAKLARLEGRRVYLDPWDFYYAGRQHGWKMVRLDEGPASAGLPTLVGALDCALVEAGVSPALRRVLASLEWPMIAQVEVPSTAARLGSGQASPARRLELYCRAPVATMIQ